MSTLSATTSLVIYRRQYRKLMCFGNNSWLTASSILKAWCFCVSAFSYGIKNPEQNFPSSSHWLQSCMSTAQMTCRCGDMLRDDPLGNTKRCVTKSQQLYFDIVLVPVLKRCVIFYMLGNMLFNCKHIMRHTKHTRAFTPFRQQV